MIANLSILGTMSNDQHDEQHVNITWQALENLIDKAVSKSVKKTVNGRLESLREEFNTKIDKYHKEHCEHIEEIKPYLEGLRLITIGSRALKWLAGILVAIGAILTFIMKFFR